MAWTLNKDGGWLDISNGEGPKAYSTARKVLAYPRHGSESLRDALRVAEALTKQRRDWFTIG
jgi:hypothetical protein